MSSDETKMEAAYEQLMEENIRGQLEKNGTMALLRSELHVKVLKMMRGQPDITRAQLLIGGSTKSPENRSLTKLINNLVKEFLHWFGYKHTLETFCMETDENMANRTEMEKMLSFTPDSKDIPLLAQLIMRESEFNPDKVSANRIVQLPDPLSSMAKRCSKLKEEIEALRTQRETKVQKLVQYNRKLIKNNPYGNQSTPKKAQNTPCSLKKENSKVCIDSSESDILESDYSEDDSEDSDAYKDIPDRHVYIEDLPPEGKYAPGHGEEGPYEAKQNKARSVFLNNKYKQEHSADNIPSSSKKQISSNSSRYQTPNSDDCDSEDKDLLRRKDKVLRKKKPFNWKSPKKFPSREENGLKSDDESVLAVTKPECPDTHIGKMEFDSQETSDDD
ncbi:uncharacterized protein LOC108096231 [Drosophila ficusphila]|uniref:uncharacterized protein LOC108096231 n=1 Tax=Drosophila ficusphila TaxID=30025 RepID=UPI0007E788CC|nr:uncharacterized protein LOC108096231 [Drosophila ficusphila]